MYIWRAALWLALAIVITPFTWTGVSFAFAAILRRGMESPGMLPPVGLITMFGFMAMPLLAVVYVPLLVFWSKNVRRTPWLESSWLGVFVSTVILTLPGALCVGIAFREMVPFFLAFVSGWLGLLVPRGLSRRLHPGTFLSDG